MEYDENMDYRELLLEEFYQYEKECEELDYYVGDLAGFPGALVDVRLNNVYEFNLGIEVLGIKEGN